MHAFIGGKPVSTDVFLSVILLCLKMYWSTLVKILKTVTHLCVSIVARVFQSVPM